MATPRRHHRRPAAETPSRTVPRRTAARRATAPGAGMLLPAAGSAAPRRRRSPGNRGCRTKAASRGPGDSYQRAPRAPTPASTSAASIPPPGRGSPARATWRHSVLTRAIVEAAARNARRSRCLQTPTRETGFVGRITDSWK